MGRNESERGDNEGAGITNRGIDQERAGQDYVMDVVEGMEMDGERDDLGTGDRLAGKVIDIGRDLDEVRADDDSGQATDVQPGGERRIDSRDAAPDHSHH